MYILLATLHIHTMMCCVVGEGWVDTKDPNVIAETELLQAAASIEAAAKKLSELQPRKAAVSPDDLVTLLALSLS